MLSVDKTGLETIGFFVEVQNGHCSAWVGGARWSVLMQGFLNALGSQSILYLSTLMSHERIVVGRCYVKMIGSIWNRAANRALQNFNFLVVIIGLAGQNIFKSLQNSHCNKNIYKRNNWMTPSLTKILEEH